MFLKFLERHAAIAIGIDLLEDFLSLVWVSQGHWPGFEFFEAEQAVSAGVEFLENFLRWWTLTSFWAAWTTWAAGTLGWLIFSEA